MVFKKGDTTDPTNYRPITVSPVLSKVATKLINERLVKLIEKENLLNESQLGFRPKKSCTHGVYILSTVIGKMKRSKLKGVLTFVDLKAAYDSVDRNRLFEAMNKLGLGGKVQGIIGSLYHQDKIIFEVNGSNTEPLYLKQGVRQGCNLSPTLFNILMREVADKLQGREGGIALGGQPLVILLYADDICLISLNNEVAKDHFKELQKACLDIGLKVNLKKSEIVVKKGDYGIEVLKNLPLEIVAFYKYLGVQLAIERARYFSVYSASRALKAKAYCLSTISLARNSPCPALFAWRIWRLVALPAILYGCEAVLIREKELEMIEKEQATVAKFILQVGPSTQNVVAQVLADLEPVEVVYWRRVLKFYTTLHRQKENSWLYKAFKESEDIGTNYIGRVTEKLQELQIRTSEDIEEQLNWYSASTTNKAIRSSATTNKLLNCVSTDEPTRRSRLFGFGVSAKTYHEFMCMNAGLGNRTPLDGRVRTTHCPLCPNSAGSLNEIHVLMECPALEEKRDASGIRAFMNLDSRAGLSSLGLYREFWQEWRERETISQRIEAAREMRTEFLTKIGSVD